MHQEQWGFQSFLRGLTLVLGDRLSEVPLRAGKIRGFTRLPGVTTPLQWSDLYLDQLSARTLTPYGARLTELETDLPESRSRYVFFKGISNALEVWLSR